jgi:hypothetical protein
MGLPLYAEIELKLGTPLADFLRDRRADGVPWRKLAIELTDKTGIDVTGETLRVWHQGIPARVA